MVNIQEHLESACIGQGEPGPNPEFGFGLQIRVTSKICRGLPRPKTHMQPNFREDPISCFSEIWAKWWKTCPNS